MAQSIDVIRKNSTTHGSYEAEIDGVAAKAELTWKARDDLRIADHTFTPPAARGRGIALMLVEALVADARADGFKVLPQCPYVVNAFNRNPGWADVRA